MQITRNIFIIYKYYSSSVIVFINFVKVEIIIGKYI